MKSTSVVSDEECGFIRGFRNIGNVLTRGMGGGKRAGDLGHVAALLLDAAALTAELTETHAVGADCTKLEKENASQRLITQPVVGMPKKGR